MLPVNYKFILRIDSPKKNGKYPLLLRFSQTVNNKQIKKDITLKQINLLASEWNEEKQFVIKNERAKDFNILIGSYKNKINKKLLDAEISGIDIQISDIIEAIQKKEILTYDFYKFGYEMIELWKGKISHETLRHYKATLTKLSKFRPELYFKDITFDFLSQYEHYMRNELNNGSNTVFKTFFYIRQIWKAAIDRNIVSTNPFEKIKIRKTEPNRSFLTPDELVKLEELYHKKQLPTKLQEALKCFLFQCYTGLRYGELKIFTMKNIVDNQIIIKQPKVERIKYIPLSDYAKNILKENSEFHIVSNQKYNEYMKLIAIAANIDKSISTHTARHTFGTICLKLGIDIRVIADILGHGSLNNIKWYTHVYNKIRNEAIEKWNTK